MKLENAMEVFGKLASHGIDVTIKSKSTFEIDGFYKSGTVCVDIENDTITGRYNEVEKIAEWNDLLVMLISLNHYWWERSKERYDRWVIPDAGWLPLLIESGLIKEKINTVKTYE